MILSGTSIARMLGTTRMIDNKHTGDNKKERDKKLARCNNGTWLVDCMIRCNIVGMGAAW